MFNLSVLVSNLLAILAAAVLIGLTVIAVVFIASFVYIMVRNLFNAATKDKGEK